MIIVETAYPCVKCKREIDPQNEHCQYCGAKQPDLKGRVLYNVFYRRIGGKSFNMLIGGIVLEIEDAKEFLKQYGASSLNEYFIGSCIFSTDTINEDKFPVQNWIPFIDGEFGEDQGPQEIKFCSLE